jgi:YbgC/YbaW family acyl-CoA thioester hydrolase
MIETKDQERRKARRVSIKLPAKIKIDKEEIEVEVVSVGEKGLRFEIQKKLKLSINDAFQTYFLSDNLSSYQPFNCKIVWYEQKEDKILYCAEYTNYSDNNLELINKIFEMKNKKIFAFHKIVYIGDTNIEGNVYFAKYFEWQGHTREEFWRKYSPIDFLKEKILLITREAVVNYVSPAFLYDEVLIFIKTANIKNVSLDLHFLYVNKNNAKTLAFGKQKIVFADLSGKLVKIPDIIKIGAMMFS